MLRRLQVGETRVNIRRNTRVPGLAEVSFETPSTMAHERPERRARSVALIGLMFQVLLAAFYIVLSVWSESEAIRALSLLTGIGVLIWLPLVLLYHQRALVQDEAFESEQLRQEQASGVGGEAIFDVDDEQLLLARRRLRWMYRWVLPGFAVAIILALAVAGLRYWSWELGQSVTESQGSRIRHGNVIIWFLGGSAFLSFLLSRYAVGMAREREWQMLRSGASYLMGMTLGAVGLAASLGVLHATGSATTEHVIAYVLRLLLLALAVEFGLNLVLDFYRPRAPDEEPRPAFDSRLLGLFTEPGGIARSIAEAINYQFGFEVSSTWFYKLLERSVVPLAGFAVVMLFAASCLVFVDANEVAVVERYGRRVIVERDGRSVAELGPGLHLKYPWPIDVAYKVKLRQVHAVKIGLKEETADVAKKKKKELLLWTTEHAYEPHLKVLVATPKLEEYLATERAGEPATATRPEEGVFGQAGKAVPVSLLRISVALQYHIRDAYDWITKYKDPEQMLEAIANRETIRHCACVDVESLLGQQRGPLEKTLWKAVQQAADDTGLGVDILFLGLQGVHPPEDTAEAFQKVIGAEQERTAAIRSAHADYNKRLSKVAGDVHRAEDLAKAINQMTDREADPNASDRQREQARQRVHTLLLGDAGRGIPPIGGDAAAAITEARAKRWQLKNEAQARATTFIQEMAIKNVAPWVYQTRKHLQALTESVAGIRKYVIAAEGKVSTFQLNLQDPMGAPLDVALEEEE